MGGTAGGVVGLTGCLRLAVVLGFLACGAFSFLSSINHGEGLGLGQMKSESLRLGF